MNIFAVGAKSAKAISLRFLIPICEIRRFPYPQEADIIGRVTGVAMRLAEAHS
jgi:hypothetical protein